MLVDYFHVQLRQSVEVLLPLASTVEVLSVSRREIYPVPGVDPALLGVINHYGQLLWVLELSDFLGIPETIPDRSAETFTLIVLKTQSPNHENANSSRLLSCVVSKLQEIVTLEPKGIESVEVPQLAFPQTYIADSTILDGTPSAIIDVDSIFDHLQVTETAVKAA